MAGLPEVENVAYKARHALRRRNYDELMGRGPGQTAEPIVATRNVRARTQGNQAVKEVVDKINPAI